MKLVISEAQVFITERVKDLGAKVEELIEAEVCVEASGSKYHIGRTISVKETDGEFKVIGLRAKLNSTITNAFELSDFPFYLIFEELPFMVYRKIIESATKSNTCLIFCANEELHKKETIIDRAIYQTALQRMINTENIQGISFNENGDAVLIEQSDVKDVPKIEMNLRVPIEREKKKPAIVNEPVLTPVFEDVNQQTVFVDQATEEAEAVPETPETT